MTFQPLLRFLEGVGVWVAQHIRRQFGTARPVNKVEAFVSCADPLEPKTFPLSQVKNSLFIATGHGHRNAGMCLAVRLEARRASSTYRRYV